jgi:hypothetical protein
MGLGNAGYSFDRRPDPCNREISQKIKQEHSNDWDDKRLLGELVNWPRLAVRLETIGQTPFPLFAERQDQKLAEREFRFSDWERVAAAISISLALFRDVVITSFVAGRRRG